MNICDSVTQVSRQVAEFLPHVPDVKEEPITDYLVWRWRELDNRLKVINVTTFTRQEENSTTGADFQLELWLIGKKYTIPLLFQAKKLTKQYDSYFGALNYSKVGKKQINTLLTYAASKSMHPFYAFYCLPDPQTKVKCPYFNSAVSTGVYMADAHTIEDFSKGSYGKRISKNRLIEDSNPFHCMFCCIGLAGKGYFSTYFDRLLNVDGGYEGEFPDYVSQLLYGDLPVSNTKAMLRVINKNELRRVRNVATYDMRDVG